MKNETYIAKGRLAALEQEYEQLELQADAYMMICRELLDPYKDFLELDLEKAMAMIANFRQTQLAAIEIKEVINKIKSDYGWK